MEERDVGRELRSVMGRFPTGVTVVAGVTADGRPFGLTVNSFTSVSLDPPLVLVCIDRGAASHDPLVDASRFSINVLSAHQSDVADRFASEPSQGRFDDVSWVPSKGGAPLIDGACGWLECSTHEIHVEGDHSIVVGRVESMGEGDGAALVFHQGRYGSTGS